MRFRITPPREFLVGFGVIFAVANVGAVAAGVTWSGTHGVDIIDPDYHVTAYTIAVPTDWKFAGEVVRDTGCHGKGAALKSTTQSPDGDTAIAYFPGFRWGWTTNVFQREAMANSKCPAIDIDTAAGFLVNIAAPSMYPYGTIVSVQPLAAAGQASIAGQLQQAQQSSNGAAARYGVEPQKISIDGARVRVRYVERGKPMEAQLQSIIDCTESEMPAFYRQPAYARRGCSARNIYVVRAPLGHLDDFLASPDLSALNKAAHVSNDWAQRVSQDAVATLKQWQSKNDEVFQAIVRKGQQDQAALLRRGEAFQQAERQDFARNKANDQATVDSMHQGAHRTMLDSLGRQDFTNSATGQVIQANAYYDHQWMSSDSSTLIQTNNPNLDPNGVVYPVSQSWTELVPR